MFLKKFIRQIIRKKSHFDLEPEHRNCTVFLHANLYPNDTKSTTQGYEVKQETYDLYSYRISYEK